MPSIAGRKMDASDAMSFWSSLSSPHISALETSGRGGRDHTPLQGGDEEAGQFVQADRRDGTRGECAKVCFDEILCYPSQPPLVVGHRGLICGQHQREGLDRPRQGILRTVAVVELVELLSARSANLTAHPMPPPYSLEALRCLEPIPLLLSMLALNLGVGDCLGSSRS